MPDSFELLQDLRDQASPLAYGDSTALDALRRRAEMVIRNVFGNASRYISDASQISFYPMVTPAMLISPLLTNFAVAVPRPSDPAVTDTVSFSRLLFQSTAGDRLFTHPRGTYRHDARASLDMHLERGFPRGRTEVVLVVDAFNVFGDASVTGVQTEVGGGDYGRVRSRVSPRTLRLGATVRF